MKELVFHRGFFRHSAVVYLACTDDHAEFAVDVPQAATAEAAVVAFAV
jgi:hypothetical protein